LAQVLDLELSNLPGVGPAPEPSSSEDVPVEARRPLSLSEATSPAIVRLHILKPGTQKNLRKIASTQPFQFLLVLKGQVQIRSRDGSRLTLGPGKKLNCSLLRNETFFAVAAGPAELLWIG
jgi:hypothetical protein